MNVNGFKDVRQPNMHKAESFVPEIKTFYLRLLTSDFECTCG